MVAGEAGTVVVAMEETNGFLIVDRKMALIIVKLILPLLIAESLVIEEAILVADMVDRIMDNKHLVNLKRAKTNFGFIRKGKVMVMVAEDTEDSGSFD